MSTHLATCPLIQSALGDHKGHVPWILKTSLHELPVMARLSQTPTPYDSDKLLHKSGETLWSVVS